MKNKALIALIVVSFFFIGSFGAAVGLLWLQNWFGVGDLEAFLWCSVPIAIIVCTISLTIEHCCESLSFPRRYLLASLLALIVGFLWTLTVHLLMGNAFYAFSFSVFYSWIIGCLLAFVFQVTLRFPRSWFVGVLTFAGVSMSLAGFLYVLETRPLPPDMVIVFKSGTTIEQAWHFGDHVLGWPSKTGRGYALPEIVSAAGSRGGESYVVSFWRGTTDTEREELRKKLQKSPMVERIFDRPRDQSR